MLEIRTAPALPASVAVMAGSDQPMHTFVGCVCREVAACDAQGEQLCVKALHIQRTAASGGFVLAKLTPRDCHARDCCGVFRINHDGTALLSAAARLKQGRVQPDDHPVI